MKHFQNLQYLYGVDGNGQTLMDANRNPIWRRGASHIYADPANCAVILIDCPNVGWAAPTSRIWQAFHNNIIPVVQAARAAGMKILHTPSSPRPSDPGNVFDSHIYVPGDSVFWSDTVSSVPDQAATYVVPWLVQNNIHHIFYVGFSANQCLLWRPASVMNLSIFCFGMNPLPLYHVIEDCTASQEIEGEDAGLPMLWAFMQFARYACATPSQRAFVTTKADFLAGLNS